MKKADLEEMARMLDHASMSALEQENRRLKEINVSLSSQLKIAISFLGALDDNGLDKYIDRMNSAIEKAGK